MYRNDYFESVTRFGFKASLLIALIFGLSCGFLTVKGCQEASDFEADLIDYVNSQEGSQEGGTE